MQDLHATVISIIAFIVLIGVMVVVHEFGHFAVAKLCGVRVESFSVGFGPRLFGIKHGDTDYKICALPLGGYVKMTGEAMPEQLQGEDAEAAAALANDPGSFLNHPRWQRMLIGLAGPVANFILAFVLMAAYYHWFNEVPKYEVNSATIDWVVPDSPAAKAGFQTGDVIRAFDKQKIDDWMLVNARIQMNLNSAVPATVERSGTTQQLELQIPKPEKGQDDVEISDLGLEPQIMAGPIEVSEVSAATPAARAGLQAGDQIVTVDGHSFHFVGTLLAYMQAFPGKPLTLGIVRKGQPITLQAQPAKLDTGYKLGFTSINPPSRVVPMPWHKSVKKSVQFCRDNSTMIVEVLGRLFTRQVAVSQLSGPVGIARMAGQAAQTREYMPKFYTAAAISLNLGILNLLPFPILDGGLILLLIIESILRHDISMALKERIYQAAFVVLVVFFAFVIFNDVTKLPIFTHPKP
jgi:regulator of sigma E protease